MLRSARSARLEAWAASPSFETRSFGPLLRMRSEQVQNLNCLRLIQPELGPARHRGVDVLLLGPDLRREARAAEFGVGVIVEIHRGVGQHAIPLAGAEQRRVAVALTRRWIEAGAE